MAAFVPYAMPFNNAHHRWRQLPNRWRWCCCCGFWSQWSLRFGIPSMVSWASLEISQQQKNPRSEKNFPSTMRPNGWLAAWLSSADNHRHINYLVLCGMTGDKVEAEDGIGWIVWTTMRRDLFLSSCVSVCVLSLTLLCVSHYILGFFLVLDADTLLCGVALVKETMSEPRHMGK